MQDHLRRDLARLVYERTLKLVNETAENFEPGAEALGISGNSAMRAGFLALYTAAKLKTSGPITAQDVFRLWGEAFAPELATFDEAFLTAINNAKGQKND